MRRRCTSRKGQALALIDDLRRQTEERREAAAPQQDTLDLFGDFNGLPEGADRTEASTSTRATGRTASSWAIHCR